MKTNLGTGFAISVGLLLALIGGLGSGHAGEAGTVIGWGDLRLYTFIPPAHLTHVVSMAVGGIGFPESQYCLALRDDGTISSWGVGGKEYGEGTPPDGLSNVVSVAAGVAHSLALKKDGSLVGWGNNHNGQIDFPPDMANVRAIASGAFHGLALTSDGRVWGWGGKNLPSSFSSNPGSVPAEITQAIALGAGRSHSLVVLPDGTVRAWGDNSQGQCDVPPGLSEVTAVVGGYFHSLALRQDGTLMGWGRAAQANVPAGLSNVIAIAAGHSGYHNLALRRDGTVVGWGGNEDGLYPPNAPAPYAITALAAGYGVSFGITRQPVIISPPSDMTKEEGENVTLSVGVEGTVAWTNQWFFNGTNQLGETSTTLQLTNVVVADSGAYCMVAGNQYGAITSAPATLVVQPGPPWVRLQPSNQVGVVGDMATFQVDVIGSRPLNYQWYFNGGILRAATNSSLTLTNISSFDSGRYFVVITNGYGTLGSATVRLEVNYPPAVTNTPDYLALPAGTNWILRAFATGTPPLCYQWQFEGDNLAGMTNRSLVLGNVQPASAGRYEIVVSNAFGIVTNLACNLAVTDFPPVIYRQPDSREFRVGSMVILNALAFGSSPIEYQWYRNADKLPGATNSAFTLTSAQATDAGDYRVIVSNPLGSTKSEFATIATGDPYPGRVDWPGLTLTQVTTNVFSQPVALVNAGDGTERLFVVELKGRVWIVQGSNVMAGPFLDIRSRVFHKDNQNGLLGLAFPPGFAASRAVYVNYTRIPDGAVVLSRFPLTANADQVDTNAEQVLLAIPQPFSNNKGGQVAFGPDGYLYLGCGDGGYSYLGDPFTNSQSPRSLLGKILRIDVSGEIAPYAIPQDNPFVGNTNYAAEIWALGLCDPRHFSFDRATGDLYIGDPGLGRYEEIDYQPAGSRGGQNYGWNLLEGTKPYQVPRGFDLSILTAPVMGYSLSRTAAIVAGEVYRGASESRMRGIFFAGDFNAQDIRGLKRLGTNWQSSPLLTTTNSISAFGADEQGVLYMADYKSGRIYRLADSRVAFTPQINPNGGVFNNDLNVKVSTVTPAAAIHFTTDGRDPTEFDPTVPSDGTIPLGAGVTLKTRAYRDDLSPSLVSAAQFVFQVANPVLTPGGGVITNHTLLGMASPTLSATLRYTTNGSDPGLRSAIYSSPMLVDGNLAVEVKGFKPGYADSDIVSTFLPLAAVPLPEVSPASGAITNGTLATVTCNLPGAEIHYTTDGTEPTLLSPDYTTPFRMDGNSTLRAKAWLENYEPSPMVSVRYQLRVCAPTIVGTYAGQLQSGYEDGWARQAKFNAPQGVCVDRYGTLFVADTGNNMIRMVLTNGLVATVAGSPQAGMADGVGTNASFSAPTGVALDNEGNLFVVDSGHNLLRMITPDGVVATKANLGLEGQTPVLWQLAVDAGRAIYVGGWLQVFQVNMDGSFSAFAGPGYCCPPDWSANIGLALDADGGLYASMNSNWQDAYGRIVKLTSSGGYEIYAGNLPGYTDGPRQVALFEKPLALAMGLDGGLIVSDWNRIRRIQTNGYVATLAGTGESAYRDGPGGLAAFKQLGALAVDSDGSIYAADAGNNCIRKIWIDSLAMGIPDVWQVAHFGKVGIDPDEDPDQDGMKNRDEYWAGTDPHDPNSRLRMISVEPKANGVLIGWEGGKGVIEHLQRGAGSGLTNAWRSIHTNPPTSGTKRTYEDAFTNGNSGDVYFYRIRVGEP